MKLSIVPSDGTVCEDEICYSNLTWTGTPANVHALQWDTASGWIEFNDGSPNEGIDELPSWAINAEQAWDDANSKPTPTPPTPEEIQEANKAANKVEAQQLLQATDWTATVDISNPQFSNPYLANQDEFLAYRSQVRAIAVNPPATPVDPWPTLPAEDWQDAP